MAFAHTVQAAKRGEFVIGHAHIALQEGVYELSIRTHYALSDTQIEALANGVPLQIQVDFQIQKDYWGMMDWTTLTLTQSYQLRYHALSQQYAIKNRNTSIQTAYPDLSSALDSLGHLDNWPLFDQKTLELDEDAVYRARVRTYLDIDALPLALRAAAYISPRWRTSSDWYTWPLSP
jgi:hypothetical protein